MRALSLLFVIACAGKPASAPAKTDRCAAQRCSGEGGCDALLANGEKWIWNGRDCVAFRASGCSLVGPDCSALHAIEAACRIAYTGCAP